MEYNETENHQFTHLLNKNLSSCEPSAIDANIETRNGMLEGDSEYFGFIEKLCGYIVVWKI